MIPTEARPSTAALLAVVGFLAASAAVVAADPNRRVRLGSLSAASLFASLLLFLVLPQFRGGRILTLGPLLAGEQRGFVLSALDRPDLVDELGGLGNFGFVMPGQPDKLLVLRFAPATGIEDFVTTVSTMDESEAITTASCGGASRTPTRQRPGCRSTASRSAWA